MIAFVIYDINVCGGTHKQLLKLVEYTERQGENFKIITKLLDLDKTYIGFQKYKDRIFVFDYPNYLNKRIIRRLIPAYKKWKIGKLLKGCNIVNIHDNGFEDIYPYLKTKKVYWQINDLHGSFRVGPSSNIKESAWTRKWRDYLITETKGFNAFVVNVGKNAERVKKCFGRDAYIFYCGVEPVGITHDIHQTITRFANKQINLLTSGVFFKYRNYETQVKAVKVLLGRGYDVKLHIIGDTSRDKEYTNEIQELIDSNRLHDRIIIEGQVDDNRFKYLHKNADLFLFVNIDQSWGLAVFEAMSCGLPVLVSNSVGATEILSNEQNAIFVDPRDSKMIVDRIEQLVNERDYYELISRNASFFHKDWSWDKAYCSKMLNLMLND